MMRTLGLLGGALLWVHGQAQDWTALESAARDELSATQTPGGAIAVVKGDRVVFTEGFGVASVETREPVRPEMLFRLGSTTKMFTAATLASLAEEGKLRLDRPIGDYVSGLHPRLARVTAHQLLTHTAGIADEAPMFGPHDDTALAAGIRAWTDDKFFTEPGRVYSYSNPGYWAAGFLAEHLAGKPFADVVQERLLEPLGMETSTFRPTMAMTRRLAQGHEGGVVARPAADNASGWPAGSLFSSVQDLAQFCIAFLNGGRGALTPGVITKLSTGYVEIPGTEARYGYGLRIARRRGVRLVSHAGNRRGYGSSIRMVPDQRVAVIVLVNQTGGDLPKTAERALEMLAPLGPPSPPASRPVAFGPDLARYTGVYVQGRERLEVFREGGQLMLREEGRVRPLPPGALFLPEGGERVEYLHRGGRSYRKELSGGQQLQ